MRLAPPEPASDGMGASETVTDIRRIEATFSTAPPPRKPAPKAIPVSSAGSGAPAPSMTVAGIPLKKLVIGVAVAYAAWWAWKKYGRKMARDLRRNPDELDDFYRETHWGRNPSKRRRTAISDLPRQLVEMGALEAVIYTTKKGGRKLADYIHHFGEEGGKRPSLAVDPRNKRLHIVGGSYDVRPEGIVG